MLALNDKRWSNLLGGRRIVYDPRPSFAKLQTETNISHVWQELWDGLHHQGDVCEVSYASVPHLVRIYRDHPTLDWNIYAIVSTIELARNLGSNSDVASWLAEDYFSAIQELAKLGILEITQSPKPELIRSILSLLAIAKGARIYAKLILNYSEDELLKLERGRLDHS